ncbi:MAG: antibiotic biosynthesis monooxygenase family protein [Cellvibrionaceae bacterium]
MYAVIFKAKVKILDDEYYTAAAKMRELALTQYGCTKFISTTEGGEEIAISYWPDLESIQQWKNNTEHKAVQAIGKRQWYAHYSVDIVEIIRQYQSAQDDAL